MSSNTSIFLEWLLFSVIFTIPFQIINVTICVILIFLLVRSKGNIKIEKRNIFLFFIALTATITTIFFILIYAFGSNNSPEFVPMPVQI